MVMMNLLVERFSKCLMPFTKEKNQLLLILFHCNIGYMITLLKMVGQKYTLMNRNQVTYIVKYHKRYPICVPLESIFTC